MIQIYIKADFFDTNLYHKFRLRSNRARMNYLLKRLGRGGGRRALKKKKPGEPGLLHDALKENLVDAHGLADLFCGFFYLFKGALFRCRLKLA